MAANVTNRVVLSIGFLNPKKAIFLKDYLNFYDVVIFGEGNFILHDFLLRLIGNLNY